MLLHLTLCAYDVARPCETILLAPEPHTPIVFPPMLRNPLTEVRSMVQQAMVQLGATEAAGSLAV